MSKIACIFFYLLLMIFFPCPDATAAVYSSISGRVIAEDTGTGLANVTIVATLVGPSHEGHCYASTDAKGVYVLADLEPGTYLIGFQNEDDYYVDEDPHVEVVLPKGKHVVNVNHVLTLGGSVSGTVYESDGMTPMADVGVYASVSGIQQDWIDDSKYESTGIDGKYLLQGLPESDNCTIEIIVLGHAHLTKTAKISKGVITNNVNFSINWDDITGINGHVRSSIDGKAIGNARVDLTDVSGNEIGYARTDESGKYSIVGATPGVYEVTAYWPEGNDWIDKRGILVESGKSTLVNFDFDKTAPVAENYHILWDEFLGLFISNAFGADKKVTYPDPTVDGNCRTVKDTKTCVCSVEQRRLIKAAYERVRDRIVKNNPICFRSCLPGMTSTRDNLLNKMKEKLIIRCVSARYGLCRTQNACGIADTPGRTMYICPRSLQKDGGCGCLEGIILHELIHNAGEEGEGKPNGCSAECFKCARARGDDIALCQ